MNCKVSREGRLLRLTLARPAKRNALDRSLCKEIIDTVQAAKPEDTGAILLDAEGPSFCAGMDLGDSLQHDPGELADVHEQLFTLGQRAAVPIAAYVQGHAVAGGLGLAANAHLVIAAEDAKFGLPELRVAMWPFVIYRAVEAAIGPRRALAWTLTAETFSANEAREAGLVHRIGAPELAHSLAVELAGRLPDAVRLGMEYHRHTRAHDTGAAATARRLRTELMASPGYAGAVRQFREKK